MTTRSRRAGLYDLWFVRSAEGEDYFAPWGGGRTAYLVPDERTHEKLHRHVAQFHSLLGAVVFLWVAAWLFIGVNPVWGALLVLVLLAAYPLRVHAWTRGLARTIGPSAGASTLLDRLAAVGALHRGWRRWGLLLGIVLGISISIAIIRTGIMTPLVGWLALLACGLAFIVLVGAAWLDRRSLRR